MAWCLVDHQPIKWFAAGVALTAVVFVVLFEFRRRHDPDVDSSTATQRPLSHEEVMAEDTRELLRMEREHTQQVNDFFLENARRGRGLDKR